MKRLAGFAICAACNGSPAHPPPVPPDAAPIAKAPAPPAPAPPPVVVTHPGPVYLRDHGLFAIDPDGKVRTIDAHDPFRGDLVVDRAADPWLMVSELDHHDGSLVQYRGSKRMTMRIPSTTDASLLGTASAGGVWISDSKGEVRVTPAMTLERHRGPPAVSGLDDGKSLWLTSDRGLTRLDLASGELELVLGGDVRGPIARDHDGNIWVFDRDQHALLGYTASGTALSLALPDGKAVQALAAAGDRVYGLLASSLDDHRIDAFTVAGGTPRWIVTGLAGIGDLDSSLAVDGAGRIWAGRHAGLIVIDPAGTVIAEYPNATMPGLVGSLVTDIATVGDGPAKLPVAVPQARGRLRGRLVDDHGAPVAHEEVDVCADECVADEPRFHLATDDHGNFAIDDVVITDYLTVRQGDASTGVNAQFTDAHGHELTCCLQMKPGQTLDLGPLTYDRGTWSAEDP